MFFFSSLMWFLVLWFCHKKAPAVTVYLVQWNRMMCNYCEVISEKSGTKAAFDSPPFSSSLFSILPCDLFLLFLKSKVLCESGTNLLDMSLKLLFMFSEVISTQTCACDRRVFALIRCFSFKTNLSFWTNLVDTAAPNDIGIAAYQLNVWVTILSWATL